MSRWLLPVLVGLGTATLVLGPVVTGHPPALFSTGLPEEPSGEAFREAERLRLAGELEAARDLYLRSIRESPRFAPAYRFLGETLLRLGDSRAAVEILEEAIEIFPDRADLLMVLGVAYGPEGRILDSVRTLKRMLELDPDAVLGWANLGASLEQLGRTDEARDAFQKALSLDPDLAFARTRLARLLLATGDLETAKRHLEDALERDPHSAVARYHLSRLLRVEGRRAEAARLFHDAFGLPPPDAAVSEETLARGRELTRLHCTGCHLEPRPENLPRETWAYVTVWMGNYLGFPNFSEPFANLVSRRQVPDRPLLSRDDFQAIHHYLARSAPEKPLPQPPKPPSAEETGAFRISSFASDQVDSPWITLVRVDERSGGLFVGEGLPSRLTLFSRDGRAVKRLPLPSQPVALETREFGFDLTLIGDFDMDRRRGRVLRIQNEGGEWVSRSVLEGYFRTAHSRFADLTGNGLEDLVVCGFGDYDEGRLAWFENLDGSRYREHVLIDRSGALRVEIQDFNGNGLPDLLVLLAQGRNELVLFENLGGGAFQSRRLMEKFPGFGYNDFTVADFTGNGHPDLVTVNGNNMELEDPPLRPYHGIRIYLNDGDMKFRKAYFYPMYGALRAVTGDFTGSGEPDIAAVSFFPDWAGGDPETFVLLENLGGLRFRPHRPREAQQGRWLALHAGDLTGSGRPALVLGRTLMLRGIPPDLQNEYLERFERTPPVLVLEYLGPSEKTDETGRK